LVAAVGHDHPVGLHLEPAGDRLPQALARPVDVHLRRSGLDRRDHRRAGPEGRLVRGEFPRRFRGDDPARLVGRALPPPVEHGPGAQGRTTSLIAFERTRSDSIAWGSSSSPIASVTTGRYRQASLPRASIAAGISSTKASLPTTVSSLSTILF